MLLEHFGRDEYFETQYKPWFEAELLVASRSPRGGGRLQLVLMRHPPLSCLSKLAGRGGGSMGGGGGIGGRVGGGIGSLAGGGGGARNPLLSHAYLKGVSGGMGV